MSAAVTNKGGSRRLIMSLSIIVVGLFSVCLWQVHAATSGRQTYSGEENRVVTAPPSHPQPPPSWTGPQIRRIPDQLMSASTPPSGELQSPMLEALRDPNKAARIERERWISEVRQSGPAPAAAWTHDATSALSELARIPLKEGRVDFWGIECFGAGCLMKMKFPSVKSYWTAREQFADQIIKAYPKGVKTISGPEIQPNGEVESYWILARADKQQTSMSNGGNK
jgi:hypothetical protein